MKNSYIGKLEILSLKKLLNIEKVTKRVFSEINKEIFEITIKQNTITLQRKIMI